MELMVEYVRGCVIKLQIDLFGNETELSDLFIESGINDSKASLVMIITDICCCLVLLPDHNPLTPNSGHSKGTLNNWTVSFVGQEQRLVSL